MSVKHTPGPWLRGNSNHLRDEVTGPDESRLVAQVYVREYVNTNDERGSNVAPWAEGEANASLILAAPDSANASQTMQTADVASECIANTSTVSASSAAGVQK